LENHEDESWIENKCTYEPARRKFSGLFQVSHSHFYALNNDKAGKLISVSRSSRKSSKPLACYLLYGPICFVIMWPGAEGPLDHRFGNSA
jgi:hypothetical protein